MKKVSFNSLDYDILDSERGFTVTIYAPAINENANILLDNTLSVHYNLTPVEEAIN